MSLTGFNRLRRIQEEAEKVEETKAKNTEVTEVKPEVTKEETKAKNTSKTNKKE